MGKTSSIIVLLLVIAFVLTGCSGGAAATDATQTATGNGMTLSLTDKLAPGILKLEGTDLAVTVEQAAELLPLWKAVNSLSTSDTASQLEIDAVYQQIQDALTAEQLASIEKLDLSGENMQALMSELGIEMQPFGNGNGTGLTDSERATRIAELQASGNMPQGAGPGGFGGQGGGGQGQNFSGPPAGGDIPEGGFTIEGNGVPPDAAGGMLTQGTPQPGQTGGRGGFGFSNLFIDPLIKLLETRAAE